MPMRLLLSIFFLSITVCAAAQTKYVMVREGVPVYAERDSSSTIITRLEYGTPVLDTTRHHIQVYFKTYNTYFVAVETEAGKGFVPEIYLLPFPPPKNNVSTIDSYVMQISETLVLIDSSHTTLADGKDQTHIKRIYIDGFIVQDDLNYYQHYHQFTIPNMRIQHAYVLMQYFYKQQGLYPDEYPIKDITKKKINKKDTRIIKLGYDWDGNLNRLSIALDNDVVFNELDFVQAGNDVIITRRSSL